MKALILDGEELFRLSMREVILAAAPFDDIIEAGDETDFLAKTASHDTLDLVVLQPSTLSHNSDLNGIEEGKNCLKILRRLYPGVAVVIITKNANENEEPWAGATTVARHSSINEMVSKIRNAMRLPNESYLAQRHVAAPSIGTVLINRTTHQSAQADIYIDLERLSFRQRQILSMAADGLPNKEIAARLGIAEGTVKAHMHAIFKVLDVSNRTQAVIKYGAIQREVPQSQFAHAANI